MKNERKLEIGEDIDYFTLIYKDHLSNFGDMQWNALSKSHYGAGAKKNAEYFCHCVNTHDELVKALNEVKSIAEQAVYDNNIFDHIIHYPSKFKEIFDILKKVTDTTPINQ